ncbi:MAG: chromosomal replication initiator protein DnaA [Bacteroidaceae bacterium]|nr:chromosomal replication initiator protein DnaA [Bacteroidaceae bacterium]
MTNQGEHIVQRVDFASLWSKCLQTIKDNVNEQIFQTWFAPIVPLKYENNTLHISVPSQYYYEFLEEQFIDLLRKVLYKYFGEGTNLEYQVMVVQDTHTTVDYKSTQRTILLHPSKPITNKGLPQGIVSELDPHLNPNCNFSTFIEGMSNKLARSVAEAVAMNPGKTFNPYFIYGTSGVGKTHLANAIGLRVKELNPAARVLYVSAHLFKVQYTDSVRNNTLNDFINFYQTIDVLIIDDIQEFAGTTKTQNTFFYIFNQLHQNGKQLVMTADRAPMLLQGLEDRLITRFKWGMVAEIEKPSLDLRKDILRSKVQRDGWKFPENVIDFVAEHVTSSVRDIEGIAISLMAQATIFNKDIDLELARQTVNKLSCVEKREITIDDILETVCKHYGLDIASIHTKSRKHEIVQARQIAMFLAKDYTDFSTARIGKLIGNRDHATVLHAFKTIKELEEVDKKFHEELEEIRIALKNK